ncbi:Adenine nucleotide alpha hydrolase-like superfamily protein [Abeliophyllum distichum]|uniref:tRNA(Ile)-lysidine synthetase n=1 Tax=Abeliophyllum distichum TaxID=126358 RepID=A0ABD1QU86_9LAMI
MTRSLLMSLHGHTKTTTSISSLFQLPRYPSHHLQFSATRVLCSSCRSRHQQHDPIDVSKYRETFAKRMTMAGLKSHHRIAIGVSGGPDSMALCVLAAHWKSENHNADTKGRSKCIDGLLAIVVDHGLRKESMEEANLVCHRIVDMGIKCEVAHCEWLDGRPKPGHLQEAARDKRYEIFQHICFQHQIGVLLIAHHADDQAELFILRLSRNSGVLGLAGMAFTSQIFAKFPDCSGEALKAHGILLVRPLLEFSKEDMYNICQGGNQEWVEDPTNQSPLYVRNRIRMSLNSLSTSIFKTELQAVISACRRTRFFVDKLCCKLINEAVTIVPHGYAVIDLGILNPTEVKDICLVKFIALVLQFISQKHRPVRGSTSKLLLDYIRTSPCKTCLTAASCYLCPAPGSKGTKILVCCSVNSSFPLKMELFEACTYGEHDCYVTSELKQIIANGIAYSDKFLPDALNFPFMDITSSESVLIEAKRLGIISDSTHRSIVSLQKEESENFISKPAIISEFESKDDVQHAGATPRKSIYPGQVGYFMNRFILNWMGFHKTSPNKSSTNEVERDKDLGVEGQCCSSCIIGHERGAEVRHMIDTDWIYLSNLSKLRNVESFQQQIHSKKTISCSDHAKLSAQRALTSLKSIPVAARRAMPVLVNPQGILLSIPGIGFTHCPCLMILFCYHANSSPSSEPNSNQQGEGSDAYR